MNQSVKHTEYIVAITGASGSIYGVRLIRELLRRGFYVSLMVSEPGKLVLQYELGIALDESIDKSKNKANNKPNHSLRTELLSEITGEYIDQTIAESSDDIGKLNELNISRELIRIFGIEDVPANDIENPKRDSKDIPAILDKQLMYYANDDLMAPVCSGSHLTDGMIIIPCSMATLGSVANGISSSLIERTADVMLKESRRLVLVPRETPLNRIHLKNMLAVQEAGARIVPAMPAFYHKPVSIDDMVDFVVGKVLDSLGIEHDLFKRWDGEER